MTDRKHIDPTIYTTRPTDERLEKENRVYDLLEELNIPFIRIDHDAMNTIDECQDVDKFLGVVICKNLFLCNSQKTKFYLLMMPGHKKFVTRDFCKQINSSRLSFAPPEYMETYLDLTPGSFCHIQTTTFFMSISKYIVYAHCIIPICTSKDCRYDEPSTSSYGQSFL